MGHRTAVALQGPKKKNQKTAWIVAQDEVFLPALKFGARPGSHQA
jgi:hypothetical protein